MKRFFLILYLSFIFFISLDAQPLNGTFSIGSGGNYSSITQAVSDLTSKGVNGPVTFNILNGTYNEQIQIGQISGASTTNTITFQSQSGNATDVTLSFTPTVANNFIVRLHQADYITFQNITFTVSGSTTYGTIIKLDGDANNNRFLNNIFNGVNTTFSSTNLIIIYVDGDSIDNTTINGNTFINGSYGVWLSGVSNTVRSTGTQITNNTFNGTGYDPIFLRFQDGAQVNGNIINSSTAQRGIEIQNSGGAMQIMKNKISISTGYGIYLYICDGGTGLPTPRGLIANNFVSIGGTSTAYGIQLNGVTNFDIYHNSVNITSTSTSQRGLSIEGSGSSINIVNNIFANQGGGYAYYISVPAAIGTSNYNNLYSVGNYIGYWNGDRTTLSALQTASGKEANSISVYPHFTSNTDLHTVSPWLNGEGTTLASVSDDIDGTSRTSPPDIGADEFTPDPSTTTPLAGSYTVGSGGNYTSLSAVKADLLLKGISAPVIFNILNGTYIEQVELLPVPNSSSTNTVTIQSQSGNPSNTTLFYAATGVSDNYVIRIKGADNIRIQNLTLSSNNVVNAQYAQVIDIEGGVEDLRIQNNILTGTQAAGGSQNQIIINADNSLHTSRIISGNTFVNGSYGVSLSGLSNTVRSTGTQITNNTFSGTGYDPIFLRFQDGAQVNGNTISSSTAQRGIEIQNSGGAMQIMKNKISINSGYGIYLYVCDGGTGLPTPRGLVANNFVSIGGTSTAYGIQLYAVTNFDIYHNSVNITSTSTSQRAFSIDVSGSSINIVNNIFANQGGGYAYYISVPAAIGTSNYNNLYSVGNYIGYWNGDRTTLSALQTASGKEANSISVYPHFTSNTDLHTVSPWLNGEGTTLASVSDDIDGTSRTSPPDIGADEFTPDPSTTTPLAGSYTVGSGGNYTSLSAVKADLLLKGISAPVIFNILNGTYIEQVELLPVPNSSSTNTVTIQSQSGNPSNTTLFYAATGVSDNYVIRIKGADNIRIQNLTLSSNNVVNAQYAQVIDIEGGVEDLRIQNNILTGTQAAGGSQNQIIINADNSLHTSRIISGNTFVNGSYGVSLSGLSNTVRSTGTQITNNTFSGTGYDPIFLRFQDGAQVNGNTISSSTAQRGIEIQNSGGAMQIMKNKISINSGYGIYLYVCDGGTGLPTPRGLVANNFVSIGGTSTAYGIEVNVVTNFDIYHNSVNITSTSTSQRGISIQGGGSSINIVNNIFANQGGGYAYYVGVPAAIGTSNYNNLYSVGNYIGYWNGDRTTLLALQTASGKEANSISVYPHFTSNTDLHTITPWLNGKGIALSSVSDDIDGTVRSSPPDIGADEFTPDPSTTTPLAGSYTVGSGGNYASLSAVKADLLLKGISAPVIFNILNGTYIEQVELLPVPNSSSTNTVTIQSQSGNASNTTLFYAATGVNDNYVIRLKGADNIRIQNLTLSGNNVVNAQYAQVIDIEGGVEDLRIQNNILTGTQAAGGSQNQIIINADNSLHTSRIISGNTFVNGSYGVSLSGVSNTVRSTGTQITNNTFSGTGYDPIFLRYQDGAQVNGNTISSSTAQRGIEIQNSGGAMQIMKNKVSINSGYGIYLYICNGGTGLPTPRGLVANNFVSIGGASTAYGIQFNAVTNFDLYHNSVNITSTSTSQRGFSIEGSGSSINIVNNIFANQGGGYAYYIGVPAAIGTSNYNNMYSTGSVLAFWNGNRNTLSDLKNASGKDVNSVSLNPLFTSNTDLHIGTLGLDSAATPLASVVDDIDGEPRDPNFPDIGADEFRIIVIPISLGVEIKDTLEAFRVRYYRLNAVAGKTLSVKTQTTALMKPPDAYTSTSRNLDRNTYQFRSEKIGFSTNEIIIPNTIDGAYYFYVYNPENKSNPYSIRIDSLSYSVQRIRENTAGNNGEITIEIIGARFEQNSTALLRKSGSPDIQAQQTVFINESRLNAKFSFNNITPGQWDVVVRRPNASQATLANGLTIQQNTPLDIQISMSGPAAIRRRQPGSFSLDIRNPMNVNIERAIVYLKVAGDVSLDIKPDALPMDLPPQPNVYVFLDSATNTRSVSLALFNIGAGRTKSIPMTITFNGGGRFHFYADAFIITRSSLDSVYYISIKTALDSGWLDTSKVLANTMWGIQGINSDCPYDDAGACEAYNLRLQQQDMAQDAQGLVQDAATMLYFPFKKPSPTKLFSFGNFFRKLINFHNKYSQQNQNVSSPEGVGSFDPNDIVGPLANGALNWVQHKSLSYLIQFENDPDSATAPAQIVKIIHKLDPNTDFSSFTLGSFGFGSFTFNIPPGRDFYSARLDVRDSLNLYVDFTAGLYGDSVVWEFHSIDPATNLPPADPFSGFLPVNDSTHKGEGFVTFSVLPKPDITTGSRIYSQAKIYFDDNPPISTKNIFRTLDVGRPTSSVRALNTTSPNSFNISWSGSDDASIYQYTIYVSENSGPFTPLISNTTDTVFMFTGQHGKTYGFFSIATDTAGNVEQAKLSAETFTTVLGASDNSAVPYQFNLAQNYPNPFNPVTNIKYTIPEASNVKLIIYDILGREVAVLVDEIQTAGNKQILWDASNYPSGVYFYRLVAVSTSRSGNKFTAVKKLLLIK